MTLRDPSVMQELDDELLAAPERARELVAQIARIRDLGKRGVRAQEDRLARIACARILSLREIAEIVGVSRATVQDWKRRL
jgi:hypothetical protein